MKIFRDQSLIPLTLLLFILIMAFTLKSSVIKKNNICTVLIEGLKTNTDEAFGLAQIADC